MDKTAHNYYSAVDENAYLADLWIRLHIIITALWMRMHILQSCGSDCTCYSAVDENAYLELWMRMIILQSYG